MATRCFWVYFNICNTARYTARKGSGFKNVPEFRDAPILYTRSSIIAMPWPTPMHMVTRARVALAH